MASTQTTDPARRVPTRRISFEDGLADLPKYFAGDGNIIQSHFLANLSAVFPEGEDFFVRSVRHFRDQISDPDLQRQVGGFIGQEAVHGREHRALNERLAQHGFPTRFMDRLSARGNDLQERFSSPLTCLAHTVAFEHLTAVLAEIILGDPAARESLGDGVVHDMFVWHALEESEHKAVAFDVFRAMGGTEKQRIRTMRWIRLQIAIGFPLQLALSVAMDPDARRSRRLRRDWREFKKMPMVERSVWARIKSFEKPGFHPDDRDSTTLLESWRERLFGHGGALVHNIKAKSAA